MRCEVCGAPVTRGDTQKRCDRCINNSAPPKRAWEVDNEVSASSNVDDGSSDSGAGSPALKTPPKKTMATGFDRESPTTGEAERVSLHARKTAPTEGVHRPTDKAERVNLPIADRSSTTIVPSRIVLEGKYRLISELGRGSMGTVFLAEDQLLQRQVAVKFLLPELANSSDCAVRFKREAIAMASLRNENVAQIFSYGEERGTPYFVMEYLDGETVESIVDAHNRRGMFVPLEDVLDIMTQVLSGVAAIHRVGAVHRDIKPGNIMLTDTGRAVIMDFGLVRDIQVDDDMRTLAGTPAYIAPELVEGKTGADVSPLVDIYSLGASFYELLTGSIPFSAANWVEILQQHIALIPDFPSERRKGVPDSLDEVIMRALAKDPAERYPRVEEFLDAVFQVLGMLEDEIASNGTRPSAASSRPKGVGGSSGFRRSSAENSRRRITGDQVPLDSNRRTPSFSRSRLLVADGDRAFRSMVYESVKLAVPACKIYSASDGAMALDLVESCQPNVLVINLSLPEVSGFEVIAGLLGGSETPHLSIVVICDNAAARDVMLLKNMGVRHVYSTPVDMETLLEVLTPALEKPLARKSNPASVSW